MTPLPHFDGLATYYCLLERITYGSLLHWCRTASLPWTSGRARALVLGDGDGRFLAELLRANPELLVDSLDLSVSMIALSRRRLEQITGSLDRVRFLTGDARTAPLPRSDYDLVVTNFFLDCFPGQEIALLADRIREATIPGAIWIDGDFRIPKGCLNRMAAKSLLTGMYLAFRVMTGLSVRRLPDPATIQASKGFKFVAEEGKLGGFLSSRVWMRSEIAGQDCM